MDAEELFGKEKKMRLVYTFGSTVDEKYRIPKDVLDKLVDAINFTSRALARSARKNPEVDPKDRTIDSKIYDAWVGYGKGKDSETQIFTKDNFDVLEMCAMNYLKDNKTVPSFEQSLGSGATYSYSAASKFFEEKGDKKSHFVGTMPYSVMEFLLKNKAKFSDSFITNFMEYANLHNEFNSKTMALESDSGEKKFMIAYAVGRSPEELDMGSTKKNIEKLFNEEGEDYVVQLGSLNKGKPSFHRQIKETFEGAAKKKGKNLIIYSGTSSFGSDRDLAIDVLKVVYNSHILSMNENELNQIYTALGGSEEIADGDKVSGGEKLKALDGLVDQYNHKNPDSQIVKKDDQIKVCHSAYGAIAYASDSKADMALIRELLQVSVDGTSRKFETGEYGTIEEVKNYSTSVESRNQKGFDKVFGDTSGLAMAVGPEVKAPKGSLTGLGAVFDGFASATIGLYFAVKP